MNTPNPIQPLADSIDHLLARAQSWRGIGHIVSAGRAFSEDRCSLTAAALSYYTLLAIFPLLLFLLAIASYFLQSDNATRAVIGFFNEFLPQGSALIRNNLPEVSRARGTATLVAVAGLAWTASGVFNTLQLSLNRVFRVQRTRPLWRERLVSLIMVVAIGILFGVSFALTTVLRLAFHIRFVRNEPWVETGSTALAIILGAFVFAIMYRYVPYDSTIRWRNVVLPALLAAASWEISKLGFVWYLTNVSQLNMIYGSIGAVIALMLWGYITWMIVLFCAEWAAIGIGVHQRKITGKEWWSAVAR
jgi:membrane protein